MSDEAPLLPYFDMEELAFIFGYKHATSVYGAIQRGTFPVPTFRIGTGRQARRVAHVDVVQAFFEERRKEGMTELKEVFDAKREAIKQRALIAEERALRSRAAWAKKIREKYRGRGTDESDELRRCHVCGAPQKDAQ